MFETYNTMKLFVRNKLGNILLGFYINIKERWFLKKGGIRGTFKVGQFIDSGNEVVAFARWPL